jgi:predicted dienelactone hydrolase
MKQNRRINLSPLRAQRGLSRAFSYGQTKYAPAANESLARADAQCPWRLVDWGRDLARLTDMSGRARERTSASRARLSKPTLAMLAACIAAPLAAGVDALAAEQTIEIAGLTVTAWQPDAKPVGKSPVIIFSHGFHGCATQSRFLAAAFASAGYVVLAPNHRDATCAGGTGHFADPPTLPFGNPSAWDETTYRDRADDIRRLIAALEADASWQARIDWSRLGLAGHSLGGHTVLGLGGAWPGWRLSGVKAVLALSPYSQPFVAHQTLKGLSAPVMYQGGTRDPGITPAVSKPRGAYDQSPMPKYFVEFEGAGHLAWTNLPSPAHEAITACSLAFMNHYLKGAAAEATLTQAGSAIAALRYASELGTGSSGTGGERPRLRDRLRQGASP